jgi:hypothetical protein
MDNEGSQEDNNQTSSEQEADQLIALGEVKNLKDEGITSPGMEDDPYQLVPHSGPHYYVSPPRSGLLKKIALIILIALIVGLAVWTAVTRQRQLNQVINSKPQSVQAPQ